MCSVHTLKRMRMPGSSDVTEHPTLNHIGLDWAGDPGRERGKSFSSRTEGEAGFASDCINKH
jgi:hypothetical protein